MEELIASIDEGEEEFTVQRYWRGYDIAACLANIQNVVNAMKV